MVDIGKLIEIGIGYTVVYGAIALVAIALWRAAFGRRGRGK